MNGSLPNETVEDRFGLATLQLFRARRLDSRALFDDPASWHIFRRWSKGEIEDEEIIAAHGAEFLEALRRELELQGGSLPTQLHQHAAAGLPEPALSGSEGPPAAGNGPEASAVEALESGPAMSSNAVNAVAVVVEDVERLAMTGPWTGWQLRRPRGPRCTPPCGLQRGIWHC